MCIITANRNILPANSAATLCYVTHLAQDMIDDV
jgi:hypothetical protein